MAGVKISELPSIVTPAMTDVFPVVQAGVTYKESGIQFSTLFLPLTGGTLTGNLILSGNPTTPNQAANKAYVDAISQGITVQGACRLGSTGALTVVYSNGALGVGATLTNSGAMAALTLDGVAAAVNDRLLIKNQASTFQNGIYIVTAIGSGAVNWVLTRAIDYDQVADVNPGDLVVITAGATLTNSSWIETATVVTMGTDAILFVQFSTALPVPVVNGGTGLTSTTINQILYSSAANTVAGLATANYAVLVTSSTGVPSLSAGGQIPGTRTNDSASAGNFGEFISANVAIGAAVAVTTATSRDVTTITLTPGDWDCFGFSATVPAAGTTTSSVNIGISLVSGVLPTISPNAALVQINNIPSNPDQGFGFPTGNCRISVAVNTPIYLVINHVFAVSTLTAYGWIAARRAR